MALEEDFEKIELQSLPEDLNWFDYIEEAREYLILSKRGKHYLDWNVQGLRFAYESVRNWGIGHFVSLIECSPVVANSVDYKEKLDEWVNNVFRFRKPLPTHFNDLNTSWRNESGVRVYGTSKTPFRSRVKAITEAQERRYGSILMKMFEFDPEEEIYGIFPEEMTDHNGMELIVENDSERDRLVHDFFKGKIKPVGQLERFKAAKKKKKRSKASKFSPTKFILRPPIFKGKGFIKIPLEVQILTLEEHESRLNIPGVTHEAYKARQFFDVFPMWFPEAIYRPVLD